MTTLDPEAAGEYVRREHADVLDPVATCADTVAASWDCTQTADASTVSNGLEGALSEAGVLESLPGVLAGAVAAAGGELQATPVAAPPYVVVTSRGPILRATLDGGRLVIRLAVFEVTSGGRYERAPAEGVAVDVEVR